MSNHRNSSGSTSLVTIILLLAGGIISLGGGIEVLVGYIVLVFLARGFGKG